MHCALADCYLSLTSGQGTRRECVLPIFFSPFFIVANKPRLIRKKQKNDKDQNPILVHSSIIFFQLLVGSMSKPRLILKKLNDDKDQNPILV